MVLCALFVRTENILCVLWFRWGTSLERRLWRHLGGFWEHTWESPEECLGCAAPPTPHPPAELECPVGLGAARFKDVWGSVSLTGSVFTECLLAVPGASRWQCAWLRRESAWKVTTHRLMDDKFGIWSQNQFTWLTQQKWEPAFLWFSGPPSQWIAVLLD